MKTESYRPAKGLFVEYLLANLSTSEASGGSQLVIHDDCPFCGASGGRIYVDVKKELGVDHKCGQGFNPIGFVMAHERVGFALAKKLLEGSGERYATGEEEEVKIPGQWFPQCVPLTDEAIIYLEGRGFDSDFCRQMGLTSCLVNTVDETGRVHYTKNRVIIPIYDRSGACIGWQGRDITGKSKIKYLIQPAFDAGLSLYNIHAIKEGEDIILVEGVMDAWGWIKAGFHNVVATWGKKISREQAEALLSLKPRKVFNAWDGDAVLQRYKFAEDYGHLFDIRLVGMGEEDADELLPHILGELLEAAVVYSWEDKILLSLGRA